MFYLLLILSVFNRPKMFRKHPQQAVPSESIFIKRNIILTIVVYRNEYDCCCIFHFDNAIFKHLIITCLLYTLWFFVHQIETLHEDFVKVEKREQRTDFHTLQSPELKSYSMHYNVEFLIQLLCCNSLCWWLHNRVFLLNSLKEKKILFVLVFKN